MSVKPYSAQELGQLRQWKAKDLRERYERLLVTAEQLQAERDEQEHYANLAFRKLIEAREIIEWLWEGEEIQGWESDDHPRRELHRQFYPRVEAFLGREENDVEEADEGRARAGQGGPSDSAGGSRQSTRQEEVSDTTQAEMGSAT